MTSWSRFSFLTYISIYSILRASIHLLASLTDSVPFSYEDRLVFFLVLRWLASSSFSTSSWDRVASSVCIRLLMVGAVEPDTRGLPVRVLQLPPGRLGIMASCGRIRIQQLEERFCRLLTFHGLVGDGTNHPWRRRVWR